jgi:hypothetical protein
MGRVFSMGCNPTVDWRKRSPPKTRGKMSLALCKSVGAELDGEGQG